MLTFAIVKLNVKPKNKKIMAANIEVRNGVESFVENGKSGKAWHGLGSQFDRPMFVSEALKASHADYKVSMQPILALTPDLLDKIANGEMISGDSLLDHIISGKKTTMRLDYNEPLGIVGDGYGVVQNEDAFKFIDLMCSGDKFDREDRPVIETAGVLGRGERVFVSAKFAEDIILDNKGDDRVEMYMVFTTSHDGTGAVQCMVTPVRVVCNNTLNLAMRENSGKLSLRHTANIMGRLNLLDAENASFAFKALNLYDVYKKSLEAGFDHLKNIKLAEKELNNILAQVALSDENLKVYNANGGVIEHEDITTRGKNLFTNMRECIEGGIGQEFGEKGTGLWLINGITSYYQNEANFKDETYKFDSITDGFVNKKVQKAYDLLVAA
jgi:phage/plasmid-like protein (TIGR03299 family)